MLGESCEADIQCSGTDNAGICGKDGICSCSIGFLKLQQKCVESKLYMSNITFSFERYCILQL